MDTNGFPGGFMGFASEPVDTNYFNPNPQPIRQPVQQNNAQPVVNNTGSTTVLTSEQIQQYMNQLKPTAMTNPVKIVEPSYVVTERQMKYLLSLAQGNPDSSVLNTPSTGFHNVKNILPQFGAQANQPERPKNLLDGIGNLTFGTAGRIGHTLTSVVDGVVDILTLGYALRK